MPRYFFDLQDHEMVFDDTGAELPDEHAARIEAITSSGEYLRDNPELLWDGRELRVHVFDERRRPLFLVAIFGIDLQRRSGPKLVHAAS